ncbi:unnamed protein product [Adineta steineri]|uniref:Uncharacterized protein n=3 Tax=Adineta steineri TaxID=433720 RepID=A0A815PBM4_9BILA|nr:unnamed protein product [Adineta steineri]
MSNSEKKSDEEIRKKLLQTNGDNDIDGDVTPPVHSQVKDLEKIERNIEDTGGHGKKELGKGAILKGQCLLMILTTIASFAILLEVILFIFWNKIPFRY